MNINIQELQDLVKKYPEMSRQLLDYYLNQGGEKVKKSANSIADFFYNRPMDYWINEPSKISYAAQKKAAENFGIEDDEWNKSDAVKHMVWQNELARRSMLPQPYAGRFANSIGLFKELGDQFYATGENRKNSIMDLINNMYGANKIPLEGDNVSAAIEAAYKAKGGLFSDSIVNGLPYSRD